MDRNAIVQFIDTQLEDSLIVFTIKAFNLLVTERPAFAVENMPPNQYSLIDHEWPALLPGYF